jgi:hypothetical protein
LGNEIKYLQPTWDFISIGEISSADLEQITLTIKEAKTINKKQKKKFGLI